MNALELWIADPTPDTEAAALAFLQRVGEFLIRSQKRPTDPTLNRLYRAVDGAIVSEPETTASAEVPA